MTFTIVIAAKKVFKLYVFTCHNKPVEYPVDPHKEILPQSLLANSLPYLYGAAGPDLLEVLKSSFPTHDETPDEPFPNFRASKALDRRILGGSGTWVLKLQNCESALVGFEFQTTCHLRLYITAEHQE